MTWRRHLPVAFAIAISLVVVGLVAHYLLLDGLNGWFLSKLSSDTTTYAAGYSDSKFRTITAGMSRADITEALGTPLSESWIYERNGAQYFVVDIGQNGIVESTSGPGASALVGIRPGVDRRTLVSLVGWPTLEVWAFTTSPDSSYRVRVVIFRGGVVERTIHEYHLD